MYFPDDFFFCKTHISRVTSTMFELKTRKTCETHIKHTFSSQNHETYRLAARNIQNMVKNIHDLCFICVFICVSLIFICVLDFLCMFRRLKYVLSCVLSVF